MIDVIDVGDMRLFDFFTTIVRHHGFPVHHQPFSTFLFILMTNFVHFHSSIKDMYT